jgi:hypothetical protein
VHGFDLFPLAKSIEIEKMRLALNCFELEKKPPLGLLGKNHSLDSLDKNHADKDEPSH